MQRQTHGRRWSRACACCAWSTIVIQTNPVITAAHAVCSEGNTVCKMSKGQTLRDIVVGRLVAATEEIFELFEKTIAEYEEELYRSKEENQRKQRLLDLVLTPAIQLVRVDAQHVPSPSPGSTRFSDITLTDEESEEHDEEEESSTHQQGQIEHRKEIPVTRHIPSPSPCTTSFSQEITHIVILTDEESEEHEEEESSTPHQRQSEHRKARQEEEDIGSESDCEIQTVKSDPAEDKNGEPPVSSAECFQTEAGGDHDKQVQIGGDKSVLKRSALENNGVRLDRDGGAESKAPLRKKRCKKHQCPVCKMAFKYKMDLRVHSRVHATGEPFSHLSNLVVHQREHSKEKPNSGSISKKTFSGNLNLKKRKHEDKKTFNCTLCKKTFRHRGDLDAHQRGHAEEKPYRVLISKKTFCQRSNGNPQRKTHKDEKPFSCTFCKKSFRRRSRLDVHQRNHTKEKPLCCSLLYTV